MLEGRIVSAAKYTTSSTAAAAQVQCPPSRILGNGSVRDWFVQPRLTILPSPSL